MGHPLQMVQLCSFPHPCPVPSLPCLPLCDGDSRLLSLMGRLSEQVPCAVSQQPCQAVSVIHSEGYKMTTELLASQMALHLQNPWPQDLPTGYHFNLKRKPNK